MIVDRMESIRLYADLLPYLENGLKAIEAMGAPEVGRYEFEGGFFMVQKGTTNPLSEGEFEVQRNYIDVQIMLEGSEIVGWENLSKLTTTVPYDPEKDIEFLSGAQNCAVKIEAGMFWVGFPQDGHIPCRHLDVPTDYTKIVMKLPVK